MRTILENLRSYADGLQRNLERNDERRYTVEGQIVFEYDDSREALELCLQQLRSWIEVTDRKFSWKDKSIYDADQITKPRYISEGQITRHNAKGFGQHVRFTIVPHYDCLSKGQLHAYEKYLAKLAEELSKKNLFGAISVRSIFKMTSVTNFKTA